MSKPKADVPGVIAGTVVSGAATIYLLNDQGVVRTEDLGLTAAVLLVVAGSIGLAASRRS
ncbi:hypothetical protein Kfla_1236 [Kribbella flavida DSM 17836]|uniref:Uncharacterized protein n=1 Tax=Kribbella flavida (strain DSM 17836 / JCM 10339 / NBRC 14399) TaxID=479435 RepID=D2Q425_KRIFD|nr:hypothetical protein [Kribbella flavida]ADB30339.1 hypothetical protein Kfla_1236 [Kribbella flavida DSM 17836]